MNKTLLLVITVMSLAGAAAQADVASGTSAFGNGYAVQTSYTPYSESSDINISGTFTMAKIAVIMNAANDAINVANNAMEPTPLFNEARQIIEEAYGIRFNTDTDAAYGIVTEAEKFRK